MFTSDPLRTCPDRPGAPVRPRAAAPAYSLDCQTRSLPIRFCPSSQSRRCSRTRAAAVGIGRRCSPDHPRRVRRVRIVGALLCDCRSSAWSGAAHSPVSSSLITSTQLPDPTKLIASLKFQGQSDAWLQSCRIARRATLPESSSNSNSTWWTRSLIGAGPGFMNQRFIARSGQEGRPACPPAGYSAWPRPCGRLA